ncbi:MAG: polysaccharide deacetylase family protein [Arcicella sp.]|nr:polysaccharide deacetylase family protein [Arcicella sp.]
MRAIYPNFLWRERTDEKVIYLTFDDGPIPEVTEFVLEELKNYQAKATFFCIGGNIEKHPNIFQQLINQGHTVGNHTFNHLKGWYTEDEEYLDNFRKCEEIMLKPSTHHRTSNIEYFRPPFGRIKRSQAKEIMKTHEIVMWDVLTGDYDQSISQETVLKKSLQHSAAGSIVLFHDSIKASKNLMYTLPRFLEYFSEQGFTFEKL